MSDRLSENHESERADGAEQHYPAFTAHLAMQTSELPGYVQREFDGHLKCGRLEHSFLRVRCDTCHTEHCVAFSCKRREFCPSCGARHMAIEKVLNGIEQVHRFTRAVSVGSPQEFLQAD